MISDHKGNIYPTIRAMCEAYGIHVEVYAARMKKGWTKAAALTTPVERGGRRKPITDHKGVKYPSTKEMCEAYGISRIAYEARKRKGWPLEKALTTPVGASSKPVTDHKGVEYPSISALSEAYNLSVETYKARIKNGWPLEEALTTPVGEVRPDKRRKDHLGNEFGTVAEMCEHYGIAKKTYDGRRESGWSVEEALTTPPRGERGEKNCFDHKGVVYHSEAEMCKAYGVKEAVFRMRLRFGWSLKDALETKG